MVLGLRLEKKLLKSIRILITILPLVSRILKGMYLDYKKIIQYLFPLSEDERSIINILPENFVRKMQVRRTDEVSSLLSYSDKQVRSAIHLLKFHNHTHAKILLSAVLWTYLSDMSETLSRTYIIIPVPLSKKRERQRGYNQVTEVIQQEAKKLDNAKIEKNILIRARHTPPQTSLSREQRLTNVCDAFSIKNQKSATQKLTGQHVILVDDVMTTGATLKAAKASLLPLSPASITCIALAH